MILKRLLLQHLGYHFLAAVLQNYWKTMLLCFICDDKFKPTGLSLPLERIVRQKSFYNQIARNEEFELMLWKQILKSKVSNQAKKP